MSGRSGRPVLAIPRTEMEKVLEVAALIGLVVSLTLVIKAWTVLPDSIPVHFGPTGQPNSYGNRFVILILPGTSIFFYVLFTVLSSFPHLYNYLWPITEQNAREQYQLARLLVAALKVQFIWLFCYMEWKIIQVALKSASGLGIWFLPIVLILIFGTIGLYFRRAYQAR